MTNHKFKIFALALLLLSGCNNTGNNTSSGTSSANDDANFLESPVRLDQLGVLPASNSSAASYLLQLTNYSKDKYTLDSVRVIDLDTAKDSTLVSLASQACSTVSANGSCSLQLTPHTSQSADVKLQVKLKDKQGLSTTLVQLVRVSGELSSNNGGIVMLNDIDRIITEDGNYSLSLPVVLGDSYDNIKASNGSLICNTSGYQKGSSCTYQVSGKVSGRSAVVSTRLEGIKAGKVVTIREANTKVEVAKGAHLLLSHGVKINYPESSAEITLFNSGNSNATEVKASFDATSGLEIATAGTNQCEETLAAAQSCKIKVNVASTSNGEGALRVSYKDNRIAKATLTNIRYTVKDVGAGIAFNEESGNNLLNAIVGGKVRLAQITITNTGSRSLENGIRYYLAPNTSGFALKSSTENGCDLSGKALAANESCNLTIEYQPLAAFEGEKTINLVVNAKSIDQNGQSHALVKAYGLNYSASATNQASLQFVKESGSAKLSISANAQDIAEAIWVLKNTISYDENLSASDVNLVLDPANISALSITPLDPVACGQNASIAGNASCRYKIKYGATNIQQAAIPVHLKANYTLNQQKLITQESFEIEATPSSTANPKITAEVTKTSDPAGIAGDGTQDSPWSFITSSQTTPLILQYKFTNTGFATAAKFNVDSGNLPNGAIVAAGSDCPIGIQTSSLDQGASCTVNISIPDPELFNIPNLQNNSLNSASLQINLPYSYQDGSGSIVLNNGSEINQYVQFSRLWANVEHLISDTSSTDNSYVFNITSKVSAVTDTTVYPIVIVPMLKYPIDGVTFSACSIAKGQDSCVNTISLPKDKFIAGEKLQVTFKTVTRNFDGNDAITSEYSVGDTIIAIRNQAELVAAFNSLGFKNSTSGKLFILGNDIALTGSWTPVPELRNAVIDGQGHKITNLQIECTKANRSCGMFATYSGNVIVKNLSLQGKVNSPVQRTQYSGLLIGGVANDENGEGYYSKLKIFNSNFDSEVSGSGCLGGILGELWGGGTFESITISAKVTGNGAIEGSFFCRIFGLTRSTIFKNIRVKSSLTNTNGGSVGGLVGILLSSQNSKAENMILDISAIDLEQNALNASAVGGLFGKLEELNRLEVASVDVNLNTEGYNATVYGVLGGRWEQENSRPWVKLSDIISRGRVLTTADPRIASNLIAGIAIPEIGIFELRNLVDMSTISYNGQNYVSPLVGKNPINAQPPTSAAYLYYVLPEGTTYIAEPNIQWPVEQLIGDSVAEQKEFLKYRRFDFTNTWTTKKINGVETIGIKEDSIPQFPTW
mgnify:CR=1 FL=1